MKKCVLLISLISFHLSIFSAGISVDELKKKYPVVLNFGDLFIVAENTRRRGYDVVGGKWGIVNSSGVVVLPLVFTRLYGDGAYSPDGLQIVNIGGSEFDENGEYHGSTYFKGKNGLIDRKGKIIIPCEYDYISPYIKENLISVNQGGKWIKQENGYYQFLGGKWGCINIDNQIIVPFEYDEAINFVDGVATVSKDGVLAMIKNPIKSGNKIKYNTGPKTKPLVVSRYPAPNSDVDKNIPIAKASDDKTFAFIIANENYADAPVPYSLNDGRMFKEYCLKALGVPEKNINLYEDATFGNIITAVEKMKSIADAYEGEASVIFYYAGHGFPDEKQNTAYLLPIDGNASDIITTGYSLAKLYQELGALKLRSAVVFLDACFSGAKREDQMLSESRGVAIKVKDEAPQGNLLVFSAAQGDETAHQLEEKHHGLFTYYLLKELQAAGGDVDMGTLTDYVTKQVKRQSVVINNKKQTPTVIPSQALANSWRNLKLR